MKFLLDSLDDLKSQFVKNGGQLYLFKGRPVDIFEKLWKTLHIQSIYYEQDCEPIWRKRDESVERFCHQNGIKCVEKVSHTLWNPNEVISANGDIPPTTYQMFLVRLRINFKISICVA